MRCRGKDHPISDRLICAFVGTACGLVTWVVRRSPEDPTLIVSYTDLGSLLIACAAAGWLILPRFVAPRATGRMRPVLGGLLTAIAAMILALAPDLIRRASASLDGLVESVIWTIASGVYSALIAGPVFVIGTVIANEVLRRREGER